MGKIKKTLSSGMDELRRISYMIRADKANADDPDTDVSDQRSAKHSKNIHIGEEFNLPSLAGIVRKAKNQAVEFKMCRFYKANLAEGFNAASRRLVFEDCTFVDCDMRNLEHRWNSIHRAKLERCIVDDCQIIGSEEFIAFGEDYMSRGLVLYMDEMNAWHAIYNGLKYDAMELLLNTKHDDLSSAIKRVIDNGAA